MTTAADFIAALDQRRARFSNRPESAGKMPPGWQHWFDAMPVVDAQVPGAPAPAWVEAFAQRPLRAIPRAPALMNRWQAFAHLLQQNWTPNERDERGLRVGVGALDIVLHLILAGLLLWLMYMRFMAMAQVPEEDEAVQVEFIGRGNVAEGGGAVANAGAESAPASAAPATRASTPSPTSGSPDAPIETMAVPSPPQVAASSDAPQRVRDLAPPVAAEAAQPLQVSEVREPEPQAFQLPPPKVAVLAQPQLQVREVQPRQQVEEIPTLRTQPQRSLQPRQVQAEVKVPELRDTPQELDVPAPQRMAVMQARSAPSRATGDEQVRVPTLRGEVREIPMPPGGAPTPSSQAGSGTAVQVDTGKPGAGGERGASPAAGQAAAGTGAGAKPAEQGGRGVSTVGSGAGPASKPAPGGWPGPAKSDDWGASKRNVAGTGNGDGNSGKGDGNGKQGLFDEDGSPRLSDEWTQVSGIDVDRAGSWLKRPGLEYRGTRFDRYWIPQGSLLQEWVRRGIKKVSIPIPGSKRRLECVVSLLQFGGGCFPVNPDVNEQPATARPPPDIPFKPGLQEDNGSVKP
ncbi:MAG: hypothetical protein EOP93_10255 [Lysobacteraceae bacterium]|nr:MAG: hypothetical protein EOP93_10255 [Xanthomonadaceae bacterium]